MFLVFDISGSSLPVPQSSKSFGPPGAFAVMRLAEPSGLPVGTMAKVPQAGLCRMASVHFLASQFQQYKQVNNTQYNSVHWLVIQPPSFHSLHDQHMVTMECSSISGNISQTHDLHQLEGKSKMALSFANSL